MALSLEYLTTTIARAPPATDWTLRLASPAGHLPPDLSLVANVVMMHLTEVEVGLTSLILDAKVD